MGTGGLDTNLNQFPYYDDFSANQNYYQVLYKPSTAVQARELNSSQSILQDQISKFANNIFTDGTIITGCNMTFNGSIPYVKITDNYTNGSGFSIQSFKGNYLLSSSGLYAYVFDVAPGFVSQSPNLNTLYVNYLNSATSNAQIKVFQNDEVLTLLSPANVAIGSIQVANTISSGSSNTTGLGYSMTVANGQIYSKGYFVDVERQQLTVSKYSNAPDGVSVGFNTVETIVTANQDQSLLDNSQGAPNYAAPGADRLQLTPTLVVRPSTTTAFTLVPSGNTYVTTPNTNFTNTDHFFTLVNFVGGSPSIVNQDTSYATIGDEMSRRTSETSGNFVINPFNVKVGVNVLPNGAIDTVDNKLTVGSGLAYIQGNRVKITGNIVTKTRKGDDVAFFQNQVVTTTLGNYVYVNQFAGLFNPVVGQQVQLRSATSTSVNTSFDTGISLNNAGPPGSLLGSANILAVEYDSLTPDTPSGQYRIYLYNITMANNQNFASVRSLYANSSGTIGTADIILDGSGNAILNETNFKYLVYPTGANAVKTLTDLNANATAQFEYKAFSNLTFATTGNASLSISSSVGGTNEFPFGVGILDDQEKQKFLLICESNVLTTNLTGTVATTAAQSNVVGTSTTFNTSFTVGDLIWVANSTAQESHRISSITNNTLLTVSHNFSNSFSGANYAINYVPGEVVPDLLAQANVNILSSNSLSINFNQTFASSFNATLFYNVLRVGASPAKKKLNNSVFVTINCSNNAANNTGPWCLGVPDGYQLIHVYVGASYSNTNPDQVLEFTLDSGQRDLYYGPSYLVPRPGTTVSPSSLLLVELASFTQDTSTGSGFFSIDSYPIDDTGATANTIFTYQVPVYISPVSGAQFDLRNSVDFRLYCVNTIPYVTTASAAVTNTQILNPSNTLTFNTGTVPVVDTNFESDLQFYLGRYDKIGLDRKGNLILSEGLPMVNPNPPMDIPNAMTLGILKVPPYPTLTSEFQGLVSPNNLTTFSYYTNKRYRMSDIAVLDNRISQVEYYTSLNMLELSATNLLLLTSSGQNRFQNGILADPFNDFSICNTLDPEFDIAIDMANSLCRPIFTQTQIFLDYETSTGISESINGRLITLEDSQNPNPLISQPFATKVRNAAQDTMFIWTGKVTLNPDGNYMPEVYINPTVIANITTYSNFTNLPNGWQNLWGTWNETSANTPAANTQGSVLSSNNANATISQTTTVSNTTLTVSQSNTVYNLGSYVTDISVQPFIPQTVVQFTAVGLRPSTVHYTWFNDLPVTQLCIQIPDGKTANNFNVNTAVFGSLQTNTSGGIQGIFIIPGGTFNTGEVTFQINDVPNLVVFQSDISSSAATTFFGTNLSYAENNIELQTTNYTVVATPASNQPNTVQTTTTPQPNTSTSANTTSCNTNAVTVIYANGQVYSQGIYIIVGETTNSFSGNTVTIVNGFGPSSPQWIAQQESLAAKTANTFLSTGWFCNGNFYTNVGYHNDPIAQGFVVNQQYDQNGNLLDSIYISSIDLFFEAKDPTLGITVQIRDMENGYPGPDLITFAEKHLWSNQVNVSTDSSVPTNILFDAPVLLESNTAYCIVVIPDGSNPNYNIWTAEISETDILSNTPVYSQVPVGVLFTSSQNSTWTSYNSEFMKYNIWVYEFDDLSAQAKFVNDDSEYLSIQNQHGNFGLTEPIYFSNVFLTSTNTVVSNTSNTITVSNTSALANNSKIFIQSNTNACTMVVQITSIVSNTQFTVNTTPFFSDNSAIIGTLAGNGGLVANLYSLLSNTSSSLMTVKNSTANSTVFYSNTGILIGGWSTGSANLAHVSDVPYDTIMPKFAISTPKDTTLSFSMEGTSNTGTGYIPDGSAFSLPFGYSTDFTDETRTVMSKSNEMVFRSGRKSLQVFANLTSSTSQISPAIDMVKAGAVVIHNLINAEDANNDVYYSEVTNNGNAIDKYVSLTVNLATSLDAEDLVVFLGAYWPADTQIYVYGKFLCQYDPDPFSLKSWTPMFTADTYQSSKVDKTDIHEYIFTLPTTPPTGTPTSNTTWNTAWTETAYLNANNSGILRYTAETSVVYDTFSTFAIKIVLLSEAGSYLVPFLTDMRAIATQASE